MNIVKRRPISFSRELDVFFDDFLEKNAASHSQTEASSWQPLVDFKEEEEGYVIYADIPGIKPEDIHVSVENNILSISGERSHASTDIKANFKLIERGYGSFKRQFKLPDIANDADIKAHFNHGVLEIYIPKKSQAQPKRIKVNVGS